MCPNDLELLMQNDTQKQNKNYNWWFSVESGQQNEKLYENALRPLWNRRQNCLKLNSRFAKVFANQLHNVKVWTEVE